MGVSSVGPGNQSYVPPGSASSNQRFKDLQNLDQALQSGNLANAQAAFSTFQQNLSTSNSTQTPSSSNSAVSKDLQSIQSALKSGDLSGAQKAFTQLKADFKSASHARGAGHHHARPVAGSEDQDSDELSSAGGTTSKSGTLQSSTSLTSELLTTLGANINQQA